MKSNKLFRIFLILIFIMSIAIFVLRKYMIEEKTIGEKIGTYMPSSVSLNDALHIKTYSTTKYFNLLKNGEYKKAYEMLTEEYKRYMPYDNYLEMIKNYPYDYTVKSVKQLEELTYVITLEDNLTKKERLYIVYAYKFNNKTFTISPDKFIYYDVLNKTVKSNGVEATLEEYLIMQDSISYKLKLKNTTPKPIVIQDVKSELVLAGRLANKFEEMTLDANEEKSFTVTYSETSFYIPKNVVIETEKTTLIIDL